MKAFLLWCSYTHQFCHYFRKQNSQRASQTSRFLKVVKVIASVKLRHWNCLLTFCTFLQNCRIFQNLSNIKSNPPIFSLRKKIVFLIPWDFPVWKAFDHFLSLSEWMEPDRSCWYRPVMFICTVYLQSVDTRYDLTFLTDNDKMFVKFKVKA